MPRIESFIGTKKIIQLLSMQKEKKKKKFINICGYK